MSHNSDVIKIHANECTQKTLSVTHFGPALKIADFLYFLCSTAQIHMHYQSIFTEFYRKVWKLTVGQKLSPRPISTVWTQTFLFGALVIPRGLTEMLFYLLLFISWLVTWYNEKNFLISYCFSTLFWNYYLLSDLCTSFERIFFKEFKNIYCIKNRTTLPEVTIFCDLSGQNDQFRHRILKIVTWLSP